MLNFQFKSLTQKLLKVNYLKLGKELLYLLKFFLLVDFFLFFDMLRIIGSFWFLRYLTKWLRKPVKTIRNTLLGWFNTTSDGEIASLDLVHLAVRHLKAKKTRTIITIGGMSIGFGSIIFLLSLGYGLQKMVISRVARLDEMRQITVSVGQAASLKLNDQTISTFKGIDSVEGVLPLVSVVSKVNYNNSVSDMVAYGVSRQYLEESAIHTTKGKLFDDGEIVSQLPATDAGTVAGVSIELPTNAKMYKELSQIRYGIYPLIWKPVYAEPSEDSELLGFTARVVGQQDAIEVWGKLYAAVDTVPTGVDIYGNEYQAWIKDSVPLWEATDCNPDSVDCIDGKFIILKDGTKQRLETGYITETDLSMERYKIISEGQISLSEGDVVDRVQFSIPTKKWVQLYSDVFSDTKEDLLFTSQPKNGTLYEGELVFGESYVNEQGWGDVGVNANGKKVGLWIRAKLPLWRKVDCFDCDSLFLTEQDNHDNQVESMAVIRADAAEIENILEPPRFGSVLGDATDSASLSISPDLVGTSTASTSSETDEFLDVNSADGSIIAPQLQDDGSLAWVSIASDSAVGATDVRETVSFPTASKREAVVNQAMLSVLGVPESDAVGKTFEATLMLDQEFFEKDSYQAQSEPVVLTIIGVIPGDKNPIYYLPFSDVKGLGIDNYSQIKVTVKSQDDVAAVRQTIEGLGFKTNSVVDTVGKINDLFDTVRLLLTLLGLVALSVAALGMFNTLTVSLLEKTREVGLMKAIGMKSSEVKRLFFAESIVMGLSGGIFGIVLSYIAGYALSFILSTFSFTKGLGYINLVYTPFYLLAGIMAVSFLVGVLTGLYPSHRATKISALNALRYE